MLRKRSIGFLILFVSIAFGADSIARSSHPPDADAVLNRIEPNWISASVRFLSNDLLEGRDTGARGQHLAAAYVAAQFESYGLKPAGDGDSFIQPVPFRKTQTVPADSSFSVISGGTKQELTYGKDFTIPPAIDRDQVEITAPVVFVGFGVIAPDHHYDDYAGVDVHGKIVAVLMGAPPSFTPDERSVYSSLGRKDQGAIERGAVGILTLVGTPGQENTTREPEAYAWIAKDGTPNAPSTARNPSARLNLGGVQTLFAHAPRSFEEATEGLKNGKPESFDLSVQVSFHGVFRHTDIMASNVVGLLPGSDPKLRDEYVVYTAHMDHLGIGPPVNGDPVYHGSLDNAGGTAEVIAMARAFTSLPSAPKRSILFVTVTAEEKGLLGSDYFVHNPPVPRDRIVADVNIDNFLMLDPVKDLSAIAADYSTLAKNVQDSFTHLGISLSPDPVPSEMIFTRSDQYSFLRMGIPSVFIFNGAKSGDSKQTGSEKTLYWLRNIHHTPKDNLTQGIDWNAGVALAKANFLVGYGVANQIDRPSFNRHYFFEPAPAAEEKH